ncbi:MAG: ComEC family competence protein, partial [Holosporales bacterium]|nr:ComEC family competence protein [Holosporales bacterium]
LLIERDNFPLFLPVILGVGILIGVYLPLTSPPLALYLLIGFSLCFSVLLLLKNFRIISTIIAISMLGYYVAQTGGILKTELLSNKQFLEKDYDKISFFANVEYIEETHPTMKGMQRITLKNMTFDERENLKFIKTAKMTCHSTMLTNIQPNDRVKVLGRLLKFKIPAIPGSFDQKQFNSIIKIDTTGVVFYIKAVKHKEIPNLYDIFSKLRRYLTKTIMITLSSPASGIASALLTGDKSAITPDIRDKFINSGTAHILAISGLHMSIIASIIFFVLSKILSYLNLILPNINAKKLSAGLSIIITFVYLALSGFSPSAIRAFIMTSICFISLILERGALSLRSVSIAAFLILLFDSASLFHVSFQLSFCAVVALISFYENYKDVLTEYFSSNSYLKKIYAYFISSIISTIIASIATFPISVSTFNRLSLTGILGNLVAIPMISFLIAPLGIICVVCAGIANIFSKLIEYCLNVLINTVGYVASLPGAVIAIRSPNNCTLYLCLFGGILLCLLKTKLKYVGVFAIICSVLSYFLETPPNIIIPPNSRAICYIEDNKFYTTSIREGRNKILSIQRNLGYSGKLEKKERNNEYIKKYEQGLFVWTKNGKIIRKCQIAKRPHPYCPALYEDVRE